MATQSNIDMLGLDELSHIFGFLNWKELLRVRVCQNWREGVKLTQVPPSVSSKFGGMNCPEYFVVNRSYFNALNWIADALPRLQAIHCAFHYRGTRRFNVQIGENPFRENVGFDSDGSDATPIPRLIPRLVHRDPTPPVDLSIISRFRDLRELSLEGLTLDGSYRFLFDFPKLQVLNLSNTGHLRWDFSMLVGLPNLKKLDCMNNRMLTGDLESLRVVGQTLVKLNICGCESIEGSMMSLAKFPHLEDFSFLRTKITGDIRDIGENDFVSLKIFELGSHVYGGGDMSRIEDAPGLMLVRYRLKKRSPTLFENRRWCLADNSPQRYRFNGHHSRVPPFFVEFVKAGPRLGWRWTNCVGGGACETHWLDSEPDSNAPEYEAYVKELKDVKRGVGFYRGYRVPPTQQVHDEMNRIIPLDPMLRGGFATSSPFVGWW